jgi:hypothetical protein
MRSLVFLCFLKVSTENSGRVDEVGTLLGVREDCDKATSACSMTFSCILVKRKKCSLIGSLS